MKSIHVSVSLIGLLSQSDTALAQHLDDIRFNGEPASSVSDLRRRLTELVAAGARFAPIGPRCEGFDPATGCPGHLVEP